MKIKALYSDVTLWLLLAININIVIHYINYPDSINNIILLFWVQSVLIGIFNIIDMVTLKNIAPANSTTADKPTPESDPEMRGCMPWFFALHYGLFHFVYLLLLKSLIDIHKINWHFVQLSFFAMLATGITNSIQNKARNKTQSLNISAMYFMPYARIIPMHLAILLPQLLGISMPILFLALKTFADVSMHVVYKERLFNT